MQTKDISDAVMLEALAATRGMHAPRWSFRWDIERHLSQFHPKLVLSKLRSMIRRKIIDGCGCGCRGDFDLMPQPMVPR